MRRSILAATVAAASALVLAPAPAQAAPTVQITRIWYDSPGTDRRQNSSLNAEYIRIRNNTSKTVKIGGWRVHDKTGYTYRFEAGRTLPPKATLTLRTGQGDDGSSSVFWGRRAYVWNNEEDTGYLRNSAGKLVDSCGYDNSRADYKNC